EVLLDLLGHLPRDLPAAVAVVLHRAAVHESRLAAVFGRRSRLPVVEPEHGAPVEHGRVYLAPRDHHLLVDGQVFLLDHGPKQHYTRPALDPLFRSAAASFGPRAVGVILSGSGGDGVAGLIAIKQARGISLVQDPEEATYPWMPRSALLYD